MPYLTCCDEESLNRRRLGTVLGRGLAVVDWTLSSDIRQGSVWG
jgi:hypothetical protein